VHHERGRTQWTTTTPPAPTGNRNRRVRPRLNRRPNPAAGPTPRGRPPRRRPRRALPRRGRPARMPARGLARGPAGVRARGPVGVGEGRAAAGTATATGVAASGTPVLPEARRQVPLPPPAEASAGGSSPPRLARAAAVPGRAGTPRNSPSRCGRVGCSTPRWPSASSSADRRSATASRRRWFPPRPPHPVASAHPVAAMEVLAVVAAAVAPAGAAVGRDGAVAVAAAAGVVGRPRGRRSLPCRP